MNLQELFNDRTIAQFSNDLGAVLSRPSSVHQTIKTVAANLELFLNARSYTAFREESKRVSFAKYSIPCPIRVRIHVNEMLYGAKSRNDVSPIGPELRVKSPNGLQFVIEGAADLFKLQPQIQELCESCALKLFEIVQHETSAAFKGLRLNGADRRRLQEVPSHEAPGCRCICWDPMAEAFDLLEREFSENIEQRSKLRWVWISSSGHSKTGNPFIYLLGSDAKAVPSLVETNGEEGLIHAVLSDRSPEILWNYAGSDSDLWQLPKETRDAFAAEAKADQFPHMMYLPMLDMDRLAAQITFGPGDDVAALFAAGCRLVAIAPIALLSGFQELVFRSLLNLLYEAPSPNGKYSGLKEQIREVLEFINESCPVPRLNIVEDDEQIVKFTAVSPLCSMSNTFAIHGNRAIKQALELDKVRAQTESLRRFGSTMLTVVHTHKRPLQYMQSYVKDVSELKNLPENIMNDTAQIKRVLEQSRIFVNLDIEAHRTVFERQKKYFSQSDGSIVEPATVDTVLQLLKDKGFIPRDATENKYKGLSTVLFADPIYARNIAINISEGTTYSVEAGIIALATAELITNAAKYLFKSKLPQEMPIDVSFGETEITVANGIAIGDKERVEHLLKHAEEKFGGSLNRVKRWIELVNLNLAWTFSSPVMLEFKMDFL
jgi:hypothetical protein